MISCYCKRTEAVYTIGPKDPFGEGGDWGFTYPPNHPPSHTQSHSTWFWQNQKQNIFLQKPQPPRFLDLLSALCATVAKKIDHALGVKFSQLTLTLWHETSLVEISEKTTFYLIISSYLAEMNFSTKFSFKPPLCSQGDGKQKAINPTEAGMSTIH